MTFSLVARCPETGMFGVAISSSSPAVAARCSHARAGVGAVASQNVTDPALGPLALDLMAGGLSAADAVAEVRWRGRFIEYRQVLAVDRNGMTARAGWIGRAATRRWAWLGKIVEVGSKPHTIRAVRSRVLATAAGQVLGREVRHPGTVARPWFQPAFDANKEWGLERIRDAIAETLDAVSAAHPRATEASRD